MTRILKIIAVRIEVKRYMSFGQGVLRMKVPLNVMSSNYNKSTVRLNVLRQIG